MSEERDRSTGNWEWAIGVLTSSSSASTLRAKGAVHALTDAQLDPEQRAASAEALSRYVLVRLHPSSVTQFGRGIGRGVFGLWGVAVGFCLNYVTHLSLLSTLFPDFEWLAASVAGGLAGAAVWSGKEYERLLSCRNALLAIGILSDPAGLPGVAAGLRNRNTVVFASQALTQLEGALSASSYGRFSSTVQDDLCGALLAHRQDEDLCLSVLRVLTWIGGPRCIRTLEKISHARYSDETVERALELTKVLCLRLESDRNSASLLRPATLDSGASNLVRAAANGPGVPSENLLRADVSEAFLEQKANL